ncbi:hypothetical protein [Nonomuraea wenchangensis]|uniref:Helix-turn-helix domain-containing protein n=1 Tax=Nonomuraea wenchangensis TaxID=568860 RepID=A0A1I0EVT7_9ACTN|nr:hypothetical protein [Nonomuraea wenchangensis]SET49738.1 hypothetical protein SAMN05421811_103228 [Nonomuraea wenchangensis]
MQREPITIAEAAERLDKPEPLVRCWASRYRGRRLLKVGKTVYYDWLDLCTIGRQIHIGQKVPPSPEERDELRAALKPAA